MSISILERQPNHYNVEYLFTSDSHNLLICLSDLQIFVVSGTSPDSATPRLSTLASCVISHTNNNQSQLLGSNRPRRPARLRLAPTTQLPTQKVILYLPEPTAMPPQQVEITIPSATVTPTHTVYNIIVRLPLRSFVVQKRYSEFAALHNELIQQVGNSAVAPPAPLPKKTWFSNTNTNEVLREERRRGLERYLQAINDGDDPRWRNTSAWRSFLNLPRRAVGTGGGGGGGDEDGGVGGGGGGGGAGGEGKTATEQLHRALTAPSDEVVITDPVLWLDCHRELKSYLHDARLHLTRRDQATTPQKQHESSVHARSSLAKAGNMLNALEEGLKNLRGGSSGGPSLGDGEIRRRRDLLAAAKKERDGLENLHAAMLQKSKLDSTVASIQDKNDLLSSANNAGAAPAPARPRSGRVLGRETDKTRELDNQGVLQLQRETIAAQDQSVEQLRKIIQRQKELGMAINQELEIQNELLNLADEDVDRYVSLSLLLATGMALTKVYRLNRKIDIGKKRAEKIS